MYTVCGIHGTRLIFLYIEKRTACYILRERWRRRRGLSSFLSRAALPWDPDGRRHLNDNDWQTRGSVGCSVRRRPRSRTRAPQYPRIVRRRSLWKKLTFFFFFFGGLECVGHYFAYVAHVWFLRDVWIRTQSAAVASWRATDFATHPSILATHPSNLATHPPSLATHPSKLSHPSL